MKEMKIEAKLDNLSSVLAFVDEELEAADVSPKSQMQIDVAVEEMFVNVASYAYQPGSGDVVVQVGLDKSRDMIVIRLIDHGKPFNPLKKKDPDISLPADLRKIGGLGIYMVKKSMDDMQYEYKDQENVITLYKRV